MLQFPAKIIYTIRSLSLIFLFNLFTHFVWLWTLLSAIFTYPKRSWPLAFRISFCCILLPVSVTMYFRGVQVPSLTPLCSCPWDGESNESMYERCGMGINANGVLCGVVEWVKRNTLRSFRHWEDEEWGVCEKIVCEQKCASKQWRKGRLLGKWKDRVKEYMCERGATRGGGLDQARREYLDWER